VVKNLMSENVKTFNVIVDKHKEVSKAGKEPVYTVTLKPTSKIVETHILITIRSNSETIFQTFPLNEEFVISFKTPQTRLG